MAFALIFVGLLLVVSAVQGTTSLLAKQVQSDFTGPGNFIWWMLAVLLIGAVGYIPPLKTVSRAFLALVILALIVKKGNPLFTGANLFGKLTNALSTSTNSNIVSV